MFAPLKVAYRDNVERLERGGVNTISKQHFTSPYSPAREAAFTKRNILAGWSKGGLSPFNLQRVLHDIQKPFAALSEAAGVSSIAASCEHPVVAPTSVPVTPVTPVSAASFAVLQDTIIKRAARALDEVDRYELERHVANLTKAAQVSMARNSLQEGHIQFLLKVNNEAKARRYTRSLVLGTAKVMSDEDLRAAYAKRAEQEQKANARREKLAEARAKRAEREERGTITKNRKRKWSQKRGTESPRACGTDTRSEIKTISSESGASVNSHQAAGENSVTNPIAPCPGNAPVARMW